MVPLDILTAVIQVRVGIEWIFAFAALALLAIFLRRKIRR